MEALTRPRKSSLRGSCPARTGKRSQKVTSRGGRSICFQFLSTTMFHHKWTKKTSKAESASNSKLKKHLTFTKKMPSSSLRTLNLHALGQVGQSFVVLSVVAQRTVNATQGEHPQHRTGGCISLIDRKVQDVTVGTEIFWCIVTTLQSFECQSF